MSDDYRQLFGKYPFISFGPGTATMETWQKELRHQGFDADDYVMAGYVVALDAEGHGAFRFGPDGISLIVGIGKMLRQPKRFFIPWSDVSQLLLRKSPFSVELARGSDTNRVGFIPVHQETHGFIHEGMADVLVPAISKYLPDDGEWDSSIQQEDNKSFIRVGGALEAAWRSAP